MDPEALTNICKHEPTLANYLRLAMLFKQQLHYFKAEKTMVEALEKLTQSEAISAWSSDFYNKLLSDSTELIPELLLTNPVLNRDSFYIYSILGDMQLLNRNFHTDKPKEAISSFLCGLQSFSSQDDVQIGIMINVVFSGLFECYWKYLHEFLCAKEIGKFKRILELLDFMESWVIEEYASYVHEKVWHQLTNLHFSKYLWFENSAELEKAKELARNVRNIETLAVLKYYENPSDARRMLYDAIKARPTNSYLWGWLALMETNFTRQYNAAKKAISLDPKNTGAWVTLAIIESNSSDFVASATSLKVAQWINPEDNRYWLMIGLLNLQAKRIEKVKSALSFAMDIDPTLLLPRLKVHF